MVINANTKMATTVLMVPSVAAAICCAPLNDAVDDGHPQGFNKKLTRGGPDATGVTNNKRVQKVIEAGHALVKEAKGLGRAR
jgi:hypothetical protein